MSSRANRCGMGEGGAREADHDDGLFFIALVFDSRLSLGRLGGAVGKRGLMVGGP